MIERINKREYRVELQRSKNTDDTISDIQGWCFKTYGTGGRNSKYRWRFGWTSDKDYFYFRTQKDATWFVMKWSS